MNLCNTPTSGVTADACQLNGTQLVDQLKITIAYKKAGDFHMNLLFQTITGRKDSMDDDNVHNHENDYRCD